MEICLLLCRHKTGGWLSVAPFPVNGTKLKVQEWGDDVFLRYLIKPPDLPHHHYCTGVGFSISHALYCKIGGLIISCHNKLCGRVSNLSNKALTPTHVRGNPLINPGCAVCSRKSFLEKSHSPNNLIGTSIDLEQIVNLLI